MTCGAVQPALFYAILCSFVAFCAGQGLLLAVQCVSSVTTDHHLLQTYTAFALLLHLQGASSMLGSPALGLPNCWDF